MSSQRDDLLLRCRLELRLESEGLAPEAVFRSAEADDRGRAARRQALNWFDETIIPPLEAEALAIHTEMDEADPDTEAHRRLKDDYHCLVDGLKRRFRQREAAANTAAAEGVFNRPGAEVALTPTFNRDTGVLSVPGRAPFAVTNGEKYLLDRLIELGAASGTELKQCHGRPDRALRRLIGKHDLASFIYLPGGPGKGCYSTTIKFEE